MDVRIVASLRIKESQIWLNGVALDLDLSQDRFLKAAYKYLKIKYPKFYKMDELSKLGFIASEILLSEAPSKEIIEHTSNDQIAMIMQNADSSVDVDCRFYDSILDPEQHFPSPALFVYTLPNIALGEIAIRNKFQGENSLYIFKKYNPNFGVNYINSLYESKRMKTCIAGWFNANAGVYDAFLYLTTIIDNQGDKHTIDIIKKKYI